ncbi:DUF2512 family protein [Paenibacillus sp. HJGM_3]|uniref:DUF2512 family protein n=1 Tax=Paenibacillus sp. HJGM_3 TaxID=3379816 RepID=UPI00385DB3E0
METNAMSKFLIKWVVNGAAAILLLMMFTNISFWTAFFAATCLTVIAYFVGDQWILRATNNTIASIADGLVAFVFLYVLERMFRWGLSLTEILTIAIVLGVVEAVLHRFVFQEARGREAKS